MMTELFASAPYGLEELLKTELETLGARDCRVAAGGVHFQADHSTLYQALLWSRLASRVLLPLSSGRAVNDSDLYLAACAIDWPAVFAPHARFMVQFHGTNAEIRHSQFGALRIKDGIVDRFQRQHLPRPQVDKDAADVLIHVWLHKEQLIISLDLSGGGLHQRGYRRQAGLAPLKENLALSVVLRSGWQPGTPLIDPMCGSGTLLIEAAMLATDRAPGLLRERWGFNGWAGHDPALWQQLHQAASERARAGLAACESRFFGFDQDAKMISIARDNARRAGLGSLITFTSGALSSLVNPLAEHQTIDQLATSPPQDRPEKLTTTPIGTVISNPPYGERLESEPGLIALYHQLGRVMKRQFPGWQLSLFSASPTLLNCLQLRATRQFKAKNGALDCLQKNYWLSQTASDKPVAEDYANRLTKNAKKWQKWAEKQGVECYRLYDADLPDYNLALDRYGDWLVMQEYAPPKTVDAHKARQRLSDAVAVTLEVLALPANRLILKTRQRQTGTNQYQKLGQQGQFFPVREYDAQLLVNLTDYLDSGLFADHRCVRQMIGEMSRGKDFLNLFAYTGTASVHAGLGGARTTTTLDMSRTYLEWAERNLRLNKLTGRHHRLVQADCDDFLRQTAERFDLIFVNPPTFSNSKRMTGTFDVQRDHIALLDMCQQRLRASGTLIFSTNKRGFKLDKPALAKIGLLANDISERTLAVDFARRRNLHHCWLLTHAEIADQMADDETGGIKPWH